jgi:hypothetical protein
MEIFSENLVRYGELGYQIVFCPQGIRVWYLPAEDNLKLYHGNSMQCALDAIEQHYEQVWDA